jgi:hypothetical protein
MPLFFNSSSPGSNIESATNTTGSAYESKGSRDNRSNDNITHILWGEVIGGCVGLLISGLGIWIWGAFRIKSSKRKNSLWSSGEKWP